MMIVIGIFVGIAMGLTGAGGALISIPLFIHFFDMTLKEASTFSLAGVVISAFLNYFFQRDKVDYRLAIKLILFASLGSLITFPLKAYVSDLVIAIMLSMIACYSLYSVWRPRKSEASDTKTGMSLIVFVGLILGFFATMTGLGGGVLLMPILISFFHFKQSHAVATSLFVISLSSLSSFLIQLSQDGSISMRADLVLLILGILISSYGVKLMIKRISVEKANWLRKISFSIIVAIAMLKIFFDF